MLLAGEILAGQPLQAEDVPLQRFEFLQIRMGIPVRITVYASHQSAANEATDAAYDRIRQIDRRLSDYDPDSELRRLCDQAQPGVPTKVSPELFEILSASQQLAIETEGAFDVTVGPVVKLWRIARRKRQLPEPSPLSAALRSTGYEKLQLDGSQQTVTFSATGMQLDLGGIAKGDAANQAVDVLRERGVSRCLVAVAGDIVAGDPPPGRSGWRIEIENRRQDGQPLDRLLLSNAAVSTSGDAYQHVEIEGVRYSHIVDPRTGLGLTTPGSVTIVAPMGRAADALATAVSVLGPEQGLALIANHPGTDTLIIQLSPQGEEQRFASPGWSRLPREGNAAPHAP